MTKDLKNELKDRAAGNGAKSIAHAVDQRVSDYLLKIQPELAKVLPKHVTSDRLARIALNSIRTTPKLLECSLPSLIGAVMQAAKLGLEPNTLGQCYLVPFWNSKRRQFEAQFIVGYQGFIDLFYRSGKVVTVYAGAVYTKDKFDFKYGINETLEHEPARVDRGDEITYFYAYAKMTGGAYRFVVLTKEEVDKARNQYSRAKDSGPWITNYEEMGCKTAIRRLQKWLPKSVEIIEVMKADETVMPEPFAEPIPIAEMQEIDGGQEPETEKQSGPAGELPLETA